MDAEIDLNPVMRRMVRWLGGDLPLDESEIACLIEIPPSAEMGDYALPCFSLASRLKKAPRKIAQELAEKFRQTEELLRVEAAGPYLNVFVNRQLMTAHVLRRIHDLGVEYGRSDLGKGRTIVIDYSSPNIAKHLAVHHLRSAIIGRALCNIYGALGYECVGINHLGDWGTGFGKLIAAFERYDAGNAEDLTVNDLQELYVRFNQQASEEPGLDEEARLAFKRLESGEPKATDLWRAFKDISLAEFERIYKLLGIRFDQYTPESFYNDRMEATLERVQKAGITRTSEDALIVSLDDYGMPPCLLRKSDESTLYMTRDICAAEYRWEQYAFEKALYVVGSEQRLHFRQLVKVLELMGYAWADRIEHVDFGLLQFRDAETGQRRKGSTRTGEMIMLEDVLRQGIRKAREKIKQNADRLPEESDPGALAAAVGIGAVVFSDLSVRRNKDVLFDWDKMLDFEGDTGPYVQYAHARLCSIMRKAEQSVTPDADCARLTLAEEWELVRRVDAFPEAIVRAADSNEPSIIANYLLELCAEFSAYYSAGMQAPERRVLCADAATRAARLLLVDAVRHVIRNGLALLGVEAPQRM